MRKFVVVNAWRIYRAMTVKKVSNCKSDDQGHSRSLLLVPIR